MVYGNKWLSLAESTKEEAKAEYNIESLVYDEYLNRKSLLEACTDEAAKPILEAQVEVLYEVSIKDIIGKLRDIINRVFEAIKKLIDRVVSGFKNILNKDDNKVIDQNKDALKEMIKDVKIQKEIKTNETAGALQERLNTIFNSYANNPDVYIYDIAFSVKPNIREAVFYPELNNIKKIQNAIEMDLSKATENGLKIINYTIDKDKLYEDCFTKDFYSKYGGDNHVQAFSNILIDTYNKKFLSTPEDVLDRVDEWHNFYNEPLYKNYVKTLENMYDLKKDLENETKRMENLLGNGSESINNNVVQNVIKNISTVLHVLEKVTVFLKGVVDTMNRAINSTYRFTREIIVYLNKYLKIEKF